MKLKIVIAIAILISLVCGGLLHLYANEPKLFYSLVIGVIVIALVSWALVALADEYL